MCFLLFPADIVRVGSRSKNEVLAQCNLKNRKQSLSGQLLRTHWEIRDEKKKFVVRRKQTIIVFIYCV